MASNEEIKSTSWRHHFETKYATFGAYASWQVQGWMQNNISSHICTHIYIYKYFCTHIPMLHHSDVTMGAMASQITNVLVVYSTVYSGTDQRKYQGHALLAFAGGIDRWPVISPRKEPATRKMIPFNDAIMRRVNCINSFDPNYDHQRKIKAPRHWPLWGEFTGGHTSSQQRVKIFPFDDVIMKRAYALH